MQGVFTSVGPDGLEVCTKAAEHGTLIGIGRGGHRGESSDEVAEVVDLGHDTDAVLGGIWDDGLALTEMMMVVR